MSLRDVERAMIVFKYFYKNMDNFASLIDEKRQEEERKANADQISRREEEDRNDEEMEEVEEDHVQTELVCFLATIYMCRSDIDLITYFADFSFMEWLGHNLNKSE